MALCLSGGGYRAALFHLGAARRLNELGILGQVDTVTAVSGGSIFAAFLACHLREHMAEWPPPGLSVPDWEAGVARPLRALCRWNLRSRARLMALHPKRWLHRGALEGLAEAYSRFIEPVGFDELPRRPRFVLCSTDLEFGAQWTFDSGRRRAGSDPAGYASPVPRAWTLPRALAASSAVPGVFAAVKAEARPDHHLEGSYQRPDRGVRVGRIALCDGGIYDNLGLEPVWPDHRVVLVSDAAPTYGSLYVPKAVWRGLRYAILLLDQATEVRKRWLASELLRGGLEGVSWGIGSPAATVSGRGAADAHRREVGGYPPALIEERIARVRIDLDTFSEGEIAVLENHGYLAADAAISTSLSHLARHDAAPLVPHERWMDPDRAAKALRRSHRTRLPGRGLLR